MPGTSNGRRQEREPREQTPDLPDKPVDINATYTPEEAGEHLRMSLRMVKRRLDNGSLGYVKIGRRRFVNGRQILAYLAEHEVDPLPERLRPSLGDR